MFVGREVKRLYFCASNKYDFLRRGAEPKDRAQKLINALRPSRGGNGIFNLETGIFRGEWEKLVDGRDRDLNWIIHFAVSLHPFFHPIFNQPDNFLISNGLTKSTKFIVRLNFTEILIILNN